MKKLALSTLVALASLSTISVASAQSSGGYNPYQQGLANGYQGQAQAVGHLNHNPNAYQEEYRHAGNLYESDPYAADAYRYQYRESARKTKYTIGVGGHSETYKERVGGAPFMKETAKMYGVVGGVWIPIKDSLYSVDLSGEYNKGKSKYTGAYQGGEYGSVKAKKQDRKMYRVSATLKRDLPSFYNARVGAGLDYRYLKDNLDQAGPGGYVRENKTTWAHVTIEKSFDLGSQWSMTPDTKVSYLLKGTQTAEIGSKVKMKQNKGMGVELGVGFTKTYANHDLTIRPYYRHMDIKRSKVSNGMFEPRNKTQEAGIQLLFTF